MDALSAALRTGSLALGVLFAGVVVLAALEARLLDPRRGVVGTLTRALRQLQTPVRASADHALGVAAAVLSTSVPVAAAALVVGDPAAGPVAAGLLSLGAAGPLLGAVAAGVDVRARLGLHDALVATTRRLLALVACAIAAPDPVVMVVIAPLAGAVLVRSRHRGPTTLLPRWEDGLDGRLLVLHRLGDRATVVALVCFAVVAARLVVAPAPGFAPLAALGAAVAAGAGPALLTRMLGPLRGEGLLGPLWLLAFAATLRVVDRIVG
jgi:hypothetical protein